MLFLRLSKFYQNLFQNSERLLLRWSKFSANLKVFNESLHIFNFEKNVWSLRIWKLCKNATDQDFFFTHMFSVRKLMSVH